MQFSAERHYIACKTLQLKHDHFIGKYYHKMHQVIKKYIIPINF